VNREGDERVVGRVLFTDGIERDVYQDTDDRQWVVGYDGERVYGVWLMPPDEPLTVSIAGLKTAVVATLSAKYGQGN
jgi:hypothetical protein